MSEIWGIESSREFQIESINHAAFTNNSTIYVIVKNGDRKSATPVTTASMRGGVSFTLVPLLVLGIQVSSTYMPGQFYEAYHCDR